MRPVSVGKIIRRVATTMAVLFILVVAVVLAQSWKAFGHRAEGERRARMERSPEWSDGQFVNPQPIINDNKGMASRMFAARPAGSPANPVPVVQIDPMVLKQLPASGLRVTWLGHSTMLVEIDGVRVLTDPMWSERTSPVTWIGPKRWYPPLIALKDLPHIDAVVISHGHYDHLDLNTITAMKEWNTKFIVPLGTGADLAYWGIPESKIVEVDWWDSTAVGDLKIVATPARHATGRTPFDRDATLWAGYAFVGSAHRAYYSGDTGLFPAMVDIGIRCGPFDITMIESGQYDRTWPDWHIGPEQAVLAHRLVRGKVMLPVHWGLLQLAFHSWTEPVERVLAAAQARGVTVATPRPGQSFEPTVNVPNERWWPSIPWQKAAENPIVSSQIPASVRNAILPQ